MNFFPYVQIYRRKFATMGMDVSFTTCIRRNDHAERLRDRARARYMSAIGRLLNQSAHEEASLHSPLAGG